METKRNNAQFRILYFFCIIFVVACHCGNGGISFFYEWFAPTSFHLGAFTFTSGYFFLKNSKRDIKSILKKKIVSLLIPFFIWNFIYGIVITILHQFGIQFGEQLSLKNLFLAPIYNGHQFVLNQASWYIVPLFMIQFVTAFIVKYIDKSDKYLYITVLSYILLGILGVCLSMKGMNKGWWLVLTRFLYFLPFFALGMLYKKKLEKHDNLSNVWYFAIVFALALICIFISGKARGYTPAWCKNFDSIFMPYILGLIGIAFWLRVSRILVPVLENSKIVNKISSNTFSIMMHHLSGFFILNSIWLLITNILQKGGFNYNRYATYIGYEYLPKNLKQFLILYMIFGFGFSFIVINVENKVKQQIGKIKFLNKHKRMNRST